MVTSPHVSLQEPWTLGTGMSKVDRLNKLQRASLYVKSKRIIIQFLALWYAFLFFATEKFNRFFFSKLNFAPLEIFRFTCSSAFSCSTSILTLSTSSANVAAFSFSCFSRRSL